MIVAVLGMHRSGTSCLARMLEEADLALGDVAREPPQWAPSLTSNFELRSVNRFHEDLLEANGGSWHEPPEQVVWSDAHRATRDRIVETQDKVACRWAFKDPRSVLVLDGWLEIGERLRLLGIFRHPAAVVNSLLRRERDRLTQTGMAMRIADVHHAWRLWTVYNRRLLDLHDRFGFDLVCFDAGPDVLQTQVSSALARLGVSPPATYRSIDARLVHSESDAEGGTPEAIELYQELLERSRSA